MIPVPQPSLFSPLDPGEFYAGVKKRPGPKRKSIAEKKLAPPKPVLTNPHRSYTAQYKLRVLSYWQHTKIRIGPTKTRQPTRAEVADRFKIPLSNLTRWKKEENGLITSLGTQRQRSDVRKRRWRKMEIPLYQQFLKRRSEGKVVRRGWFRRSSKDLWATVYPEKRGVENFRFSNSWFRGFLSWHNISLRFGTNKASKLPTDYQNPIVDWARYNRRNSQLRPGDDPEAVGRYRLSNICNMDQTPLPFEFLTGQTYNTVGESTVWIKGSKQSSWDKRQATLQLTIFADAIPRVKPLIFFRGLGVGSSIQAEREDYDPRVIVKFNPTAYANSDNIIEWLDEQVIPVLENKPTLMVLDLFGGHKREDVLDTLRAHDITLSLIPGGCTSLVQPLDVSVNRPFKDILKVNNLFYSEE